MTTPAATSIAGLTDVGQIRRVNEDAFLIDRELQLFAIADGMGGHGSGDVASKLAVETLRNCIASDSVREALANKHISNEQALSLVYQCIMGVNQHIYQLNLENAHPDGTGMGTTLVGLCLIGSGDDDGTTDAQRAVSFNIGDSRLYEYQHEQLTQRTNDHTMYRDWEEAGRIGPAPPRNIIMRAIGLLADVDIDMEVLSISRDASYLLCSDGLTGMVDDEAITRILVESRDAATLCNTLVQRANEAGGTDNISVIAIKPGQS